MEEVTAEDPFAEALQDEAAVEEVVDFFKAKLKEETGVEAVLTGLIDVVDGVFTSRESGEITRHYVMIDYAARWISGEPVAGDDAADARFVSLDEALALVEWDVTRKVIGETFERFGQA